MAQIQEKDLEAMKVLMCAPKYFDVTQKINAGMDTANPPNKRKAMRQWEGLAETGEQIGIEVALIDPVPGLENMVFTANGAYVEGNRALIPNFKHPIRQPESERFKQWFDDHGYETLVAPYHFEGQGDVMRYKESLIMGYGPRTDYRMRQVLIGLFRRPVTALELNNRTFYHDKKPFDCFHLDTALSVLDPVALHYSRAFTKDSAKAIQHLGKLWVHEVPKREAAALGINAVRNGNNIIIDQEAEDTIAYLESFDFEIYPVDVSELKKSRGGPFCMMLILEP